MNICIFRTRSVHRACEVNASAGGAGARTWGAAQAVAPQGIRAKGPGRLLGPWEVGAATAHGGLAPLLALAAPTRDSTPPALALAMAQTSAGGTTRGSHIHHSLSPNLHS